MASLLSQRTLTAIVLAPLAIAVMLFLPTVGFAFVVGILSLLATWEWARLAGVDHLAARIALLAANALFMALLWRMRALDAAWYVVGAGLLWWLVALAWLRNLSFAAAPTRENAALKVLAGELAILPSWLALMLIHGEGTQGPSWTLFAVFLVWAADTGAYFIGKRFGRARLAPRISPNKTIAGLAGAFAAGTLVALAGGWLLGTRGTTLLLLLALALATVAASVHGDLTESLLKRQAGVKDSGNLFPGHGGLLDRMDSLLAAMPAFAAGQALLGIGH